MGAPESLAARAEATLNRLAQAQAQAASQQTRTEIETAWARASRVAADLRDAESAVRVLDGCSVAVDIVLPSAALQEATRARAALRSAATSMVGAPADDVASRVRTQSVDIALGSSEKLARSVLAGLNRSVERRRQELLPAGIGERIVAYPGASEALAVRLGIIQDRLQRKVENLAARQLGQRAQEISDDAAAWTAERSRLDTGLEGRHPEVQEFLRQAGNEQGASWRLITPAVAAWLEDPENTASLRVVLRS
jgi:hypothetical protein